MGLTACLLTKQKDDMIAKIKATGERVDGRVWEETGHFKAWPPDERIWSVDEIDIINNQK